MWNSSRDYVKIWVSWETETVFDGGIGMGAGGRFRGSLSIHNQKLRRRKEKQNELYG